MLKTREEIKSWLDKHRITKYTINDDLSVDVNRNVYLHNKDLTEIPIQFNVVKGNFSCSSNQLSSLKGSPKEVNGYFSCYSNKLTSLKDCPRKVYSDFHCYNNQLTSVEYLSEIHGKFYCDEYLEDTREYKVYLISKRLKEIV